MFGRRALEPSLDTVLPGHAVAVPFRNATIGIAVSAILYIARHTTAKSVELGIYTNADAHPGRRITSGSLSALKPGAWNTLHVRSVRVSPDRIYWLAILAHRGAVAVRDRPGGICRSQTSAERSLLSLPRVWTSGRSRRACPLSAYISGYLSPRSTPPDPSPTLPPGVTLRQIDGGPHLFSRFSNAAGWDSATFYPLAVFNQPLGYVATSGSFTPADITAYADDGINGFVNLYNGYNHALINAIRAHHMWVIASPLAPAYARNTINGYFWFDEAEANNHCNRVPPAAVLGELVSCSPTSLGGTPAKVIAEVTAALHGAHNRGDRTRFVYGNYTSPLLRMRDSLQPRRHST